MILAAAMLLAPWCSVNAADLSTVHRVEMEGIPVVNFATAKYATAVCGAKVKLIEMRWTDLRTRGTNARRCSACKRRHRGV